MTIDVSTVDGGTTIGGVSQLADNAAAATESQWTYSDTTKILTLLTATPTETTSIHGIDVPYTIGSDGIVMLKPTEAQIKAIIDATKDGKIVIDVSSIPSAKGVNLEANPAWFSVTKFVSLKLTLDGVGSV